MLDDAHALSDPAPSRSDRKSPAIGCRQFGHILFRVWTELDAYFRRFVNSRAAVYQREVFALRPQRRQIGVVRRTRITRLARRVHAHAVVPLSDIDNNTHRCAHHHSEVASAIERGHRRGCRCRPWTRGQHHTGGPSYRSPGSGHAQNSHGGCGPTPTARRPALGGKRCRGKRLRGYQAAGDPASRLDRRRNSALGVRALGASTQDRQGRPGAACSGRRRIWR